jgi:hypothetical protein
MLREFRSGFIVAIILILATQGFCHWLVANTNKTRLKKKSWVICGQDFKNPGYLGGKRYWKTDLQYFPWGEKAVG